MFSRVCPLAQANHTSQLHSLPRAQALPGKPLLLEEGTRLTFSRSKTSYTKCGGTDTHASWLGMGCTKSCPLGCF